MMSLSFFTQEDDGGTPYPFPLHPIILFQYLIHHHQITTLQLGSYHAKTWPLILHTLTAFISPPRKHPLHQRLEPSFFLC
jgi:hypothetical protein